MNTLIKTLFCVTAAAISLTSCAQKEKTTKSGLNPEDFVAEYNEAPTALYTLTNKNGMEVCITNFGGRIVSIMVPDKDGNLKDVVLGFPTVKDYFPQNHLSDFGASIGRYANRIGQGKFTLDGVEYQLPRNNFMHCLHGGPTGWQYQVYETVEADKHHVKLMRVSPDGDNNFPGTVTAYTTYTLTEDNSIEISYEATTDAPTIINMTNHSYFNLSGDPAAYDVIDDVLYINASAITPIDRTCMTSGEIVPVEGTPFDFRTPKAIGKDIAADDVQIRNGNGYDHNWVLSNNGSMDIAAAEVYSPVTGIVLTVYTDEPGLQVDTGNFLDGSAIGKNGVSYKFRSGICLESQKYPDTPNKPEWPSAVLRPGETYTSHCTYSFSTR
ncbi:MAG: galactose mutarotase [Bacteroidales bacterium]|nr:galactose mutarotase [Bacteroidales bacterium]